MDFEEATSQLQSLKERSLESLKYHNRIRKFSKASYKFIRGIKKEEEKIKDIDIKVNSKSFETTIYLVDGREFKFISDTDDCYPHGLNWGGLAPDCAFKSPRVKHIIEACIDLINEPQEPNTDDV